MLAPQNFQTSPLSKKLAQMDAQMLMPCGRKPPVFSAPWLKVLEFSWLGWWRMPWNLSFRRRLEVFGLIGGSLLLRGAEGFRTGPSTGETQSRKN